MSEMIQRINKLQRQHNLILLKIDGGKVFYLKDHYKYLRPGHEAPPFLLGPAPKGCKDGLKYITSQITKLD